MARKVEQAEILEKVAAALRRTTGLEAQVIRDRRRPGGPTAPLRFMGDTRLHVIGGRTTWEYDFDIKPWVDLPLAELYAQRFKDRRNWVLLTRHANRGVAGRLREHGIQFLDTDGNAYLERQELFVWVQGQKPTDRTTGRLIGRPFKPAGMKVIFALICLPGLEQKPFREIALTAGVALGTVNTTLKDLGLAGHLLEGKEIGRRIAKREELYDKWVGFYPQQVRPRQLFGRYAATDPGRWQTADLGRWDALWGGETAVAMETGYLRPEVATIYIDGDPNPLIAQHKLKQNLQGNVEIYKKFWHFTAADEPRGIVPAPLTYADLLATGEGRNMEAARDFREKKLGRYLR